MDESLIKFYICTSNFYLYKGIVCSLSEKINCHFIWLSSIDKKNAIFLQELRPQDIVMLLSETNDIDFYFLMKLCKCECKVIMATSEQNWLLSIMFNFAMMSNKFYLSDLLLAIHSKNRHNFYTNFPKFTQQEKKVLFYTSKGYSVTTMSQYLAISEKTIYQHQRNALNKIGLDKPRNVVGLPKNFLNFMFHEHQKQYQQ